MADSTLAHDYAVDLPEYGGIFHDGDLLVVLLTANLAQHERALRELVSEPDRIEVRPAARSWAEVSAGNRRLSRLLLTGTGAESTSPEVAGVGIAVHDGQFVVTVGIDPFSPDAAARIQELARPEPVFVKPQAPARLLPMRGAGLSGAKPSRVA